MGFLLWMCLVVSVIYIGEFILKGNKKKPETDWSQGIGPAPDLGDCPVNDHTHHNGVGVCGINCGCTIDECTDPKWLAFLDGKNGRNIPDCSRRDGRCGQGPCPGGGSEAQQPAVRPSSDTHA